MILSALNEIYRHIYGIKINLYLSYESLSSNFSHNSSHQIIDSRLILYLLVCFMLIFFL